MRRESNLKILFVIEPCINKDNGVTDNSGETCQYYTDFPEYCGEYDDHDFSARELCCACMFIGV